MKLVVAPILMLLILSQSFSTTLVILDYDINKAYITQNLCENKTKPTLKCNGKCQLAKKITEEAQAPGSKENTQGKLKFQEVVFTDELSRPGIDNLENKSNTHHSKYSDKLFSSLIPEVFHPPGAL
jgi:hypothetical protein